VYLSGESSWLTLSVPPRELNTNPVSGSNAVAAIPFPIASVATTLPVSASMALRIRANSALVWPSEFSATAGYGHRVIVAAGEDAPVLGIHSHSRWFLARGERPGVRYRELARIHIEHRVVVFDIDVNVTGAIRRGKLRFTFQRNRARRGPFFGTMAVASELRPSNTNTRLEPGS
jgi:hypothetical protein